MTKKFLGMWSVHKELQDDDPEAVQKLSQKLADEVNEKINEQETQKRDAVLKELAETLVEDGVKHEMDMAKAMGVDLKPEDARAGVVEYMQTMFKAIKKENAEDEARVRFNEERLKDNLK